MIIYAPNIHTGGGYILLKGLLSALPRGVDVVLFLDLRIKEKIELADPKIKVHWVKRSFWSRMRAEKILQELSDSNSQTLCFNGTPPLLRCRGSIWVYVQNRLLIASIGQYRIHPLVWLRIQYEKLVFYKGRKRVDHYLVQTATMAENLSQWLEKRGVAEARSKVFISPFFDFESDDTKEYSLSPEQKRYDFCYVAEGYPHKNHTLLLEALVLLAEQGIYPSVALTLGPRDHALIAQLGRLKEEYDLKVDNLGTLHHAAVVNLYKRSSALLYPSLLESFGLPLIEASRLGLPIVAAEMSYVRDVCRPQETFDPRSARSFARAMRRFLKLPEDPVKIQSSQKFLESMNLENIRK